MNLGKAIKSLRKRENLKQFALANFIGISQTSLSLIESGSKQPSKGTLQKISMFFQIPEPFIYFLALEDSDIPEDKKELYKVIGPGLKTNIEALFVSN